MPLVKKLLKLMQLPQELDYVKNPYRFTDWEQEKHVREYLLRWNHKLSVDKSGNAYLIRPDTILLCAHMDTVGSLEAQKNLHKIKLIDGAISGTHNIGADDKCWIAIAMELYETNPDRFSLLFTVGEESGGLWVQDFVDEHADELRKLKYCVIADRKWSKDIIWSNNGYCTEEFNAIVHEYMKPFWYKPEIGVYCDADVLYEYLNCINVSCGYYNAHTNDEFVVVDEFQNAFNALLELTNKLDVRLDPPAHQQFSRRLIGFDTTYSGSWYKGTTYWGIKQPSYPFYTFKWELVLTWDCCIYSEKTGMAVNLAKGTYKIDWLENDDDEDDNEDDYEAQMY